MRTQELDDVELYRELIRRGLPQDYAQRVASELHDHHSDLVAEIESDCPGSGDAEQKAEARLGCPAALVKRIAGDYRRRSWCGRWPLLSFVLLPLPLLLAAWIATYLVIGAIAFTCMKMGIGRLSALAQEIALHSAFCVVLIVVPSIIAFFWGRLALKTTGNHVFVLVPCILLAIAAGGIWYEFAVSDIPGKSYYWMGSPAFTPSSSWLTMHPFGLHQLCQLIAPLTVGARLIAVDRRQRLRALQVDLASPTSRIAA